MPCAADATAAGEALSGVEGRRLAGVLRALAEPDSVTNDVPCHEGGSVQTEAKEPPANSMGGGALRAGPPSIAAELAGGAPVLTGGAFMLAEPPKICVPESESSSSSIWLWSTFLLFTTTSCTSAIFSTCFVTCL